MPAARDEDWSAIAAQAAAGATLEDLAEHWNIPLGTLKWRCAHEGWKRMAREIQAEKSGQPIASPRHPTIQPRSTERSVSLSAKLGERSKLLGARVGHSMLRTISRKKDDALLAQAQPFKSTVDALAKIHDWGAQTPNLTQINVNLGQANFQDSPK